MRILSAKALRNSEETAEGRFSWIIPGLGLFHFMWEIQKIVLVNWWGNQASPGSLSWLKVALNAQSVSMDGKKFSYCDDFLREVLKVKFLEALQRAVGKKLEDTTEPDLESLLTFVLKPQESRENQHLASLLQGVLIYAEVRELSELIESQPITNQKKNNESCARQSEGETISSSSRS